MIIIRLIKIVASSKHYIINKPPKKQTKTKIKQKTKQKTIQYINRHLKVYIQSEPKRAQEDPEQNATHMVTMI